eukprot:GHVN01080968.1.p1 GENE.GHVN01080968.1~~GHVN01080968.1.p1  ORF type:complete len:104 (-),score=7.50 GHVN01080968.1:28-339(-)
MIPIPFNFKCIASYTYEDSEKTHAHGREQVSAARMPVPTIFTPGLPPHLIQDLVQHGGGKLRGAAGNYGETPLTHILTHHLIHVIPGTKLTKSTKMEPRQESW